MGVIYRTGTLQDLRAIAACLYQATMGLSQYLVSGIFEQCDVIELLEMAVADRDTPMYYKHTLVAEIEGKVVGAITAYPSEEHIFPDLLYAYLTPEKQRTILPFFRPLPPGGKYVYAMACLSESVKHGIFRGLTTRRFQAAKQEGCDAAYLHVLENNMKFLAFLRGAMSVVEKIQILPQQDYHIPDHVYLLRLEIAKRHACWHP